jgi:hypothetical protein
MLPRLQNILNQGTVTLGSVTEPNAITITQPVIAADKPVKLTGTFFDWKRENRGL